MADHNISHSMRAASYEDAYQALKDKIEKRGDLVHAKAATQLTLLKQLGDFDLGKFLIEHGGLNGYWINYIVSHPEKKYEPNQKKLTSLENFLLNSAPVFLSTQQRFQIFKTETQKLVRENCAFASIPCGIMSDLLDLNYSGISHFTLTGIDLDPETLLQAKEYTLKKGLQSHCRFLKKDAWNLGITEEFDLITSNGLAVYEPDDKKVDELHREFYKALKRKGKLITSFFTPPNEIHMDLIHPEDSKLARILLTDILEVKWQIYRPEAMFVAHLKEVGFAQVEVLYDKVHMYPTVIATKA